MRLLPIVAAALLAACAAIGPWQAREDGNTCRRISGPLGLGRGHYECRGGVRREAR